MLAHFLEVMVWSLAYVIVDADPTVLIQCISLS